MAGINKLLLFFPCLLLIGCIVPQPTIRESISQKSMMSSEDLMEAVMRSDRAKFIDMPFEEQAEFVEKGYFYSCYQVIDFCNKYPENAGCIHYCQKYIGLELD